MALPTTLTDLRTQRRSQLETEYAGLQARIRSIQTTDLPNARAAYDLLLKDAASLAASIAAARQAIANAPTDADRDIQSQLIETDASALAINRAEQVEALRLVTALTDELGSIGPSASALAVAITTAKSDEAAAAARATRLQGAGDALAAPPLSTLKDDATAAQAGIAAADTRIQNDIPAAVLNHAQQRRQTIIDSLKASQASVNTAAPLAADKLKQAVIVAENNLFSYIALGKSRLDAAEATLVSVADPNNAKLTAAQIARLNDPAILAAWTAAAAKQKDLDDAEKALDQKQSDLDDAILTARNSDVDVDPATVAAVQTATSDRDTAKAARDTAAAAFTPALQQDLQRLERALPDDNWKLIDQLEEARVTLNDLAGLDPATLIQTVTGTETAWVADLYTTDKKERTARSVALETARRANALKFESNINRDRRLSAVRGDL